jgi:ribose/xylose/arabinose/galactoside ABC-type transport system permease subunit
MTAGQAETAAPVTTGNLTQRPRRDVWRELGVWGVLIALYLALAVREPSFRGLPNLRNVLTQIAIVALVGVGMTFVIITGGIDLSVGSVAALAECSAAVMMVKHHWPAAAGVMLTLGVGTGVGLVNAFGLTTLGLPPFIATLATMVMARGLAFVVSGGGAIYGLPDAYLWAGGGNVAERVPFIEKLPFMIVLVAAVFVAGHILLRRTRVGRYIYSIGANEEATRLSGVPTARVKLLAYATCGLLAGLAGMLYAGRVAASEPTAGDGLELDVIAAVVIGGSSLSGGQGNLPGTFAGALLIGLVRNGLNLMQVDSNYQRVAIGGIIFVAVTIDMYQKKRRRA